MIKQMWLNVDIWGTQVKEIQEFFALLQNFSTSEIILHWKAMEDTGKLSNLRKQASHPVYTDRSALQFTKPPEVQSTLNLHPWHVELMWAPSDQEPRDQASEWLGRQTAGGRLPQSALLNCPPTLYSSCEAELNY